MRVYRIAKKRFVSDLSGEGARLYGGRWNRKGSSLLYTSESRALAIVEFLVHLSPSIVPKDVCLAEIEVPNAAKIRQVEIEGLPRDWASYPAPMALCEMTEEWIRRGRELLLRVPSAVVRDEWNFLVNPGHPSFEGVKIVSIQEHVLDPRLLKKKDASRA
jgi:RES domain-containing protein